MTASMRVQARAEATRQRIIDASVALFKQYGFSGTNLSTIIRRANTTAGAFYYHFESKEAVAFAIIDEVADRMADLRGAHAGVPGSGLGNVIAMSFQLSVLLDQDDSFWVAAYLEHTMARHTDRGIVDVSRRIETFIAVMAGAIGASELREGISPETAARTMFTTIYGSLVMTGLVVGDITTRFAECWRILLPGLVAPGSLTHFEDMLSRTVSNYKSPDIAVAAGG